MLSCGAPLVAGRCSCRWRLSVCVSSAGCACAVFLFASLGCRCLRSSFARFRTCFAWRHCLLTLQSSAADISSFCHCVCRSNCFPSCRSFSRALCPGVGCCVLPLLVSSTVVPSVRLAFGLWVRSVGYLLSSNCFRAVFSATALLRMSPLALAVSLPPVSRRLPRLFYPATSLAR